MNILFITIENYKDCQCRSIYMDMINEFIRCGHYVTVLSACEARDRKQDDRYVYNVSENCDIQKVYIPNLTKMSNFLLKGINLLRTIPSFDIAAKKAMRKRRFDLIVYGSPPISIYRAIRSVKRTQGSTTYLMLKDIWPYDCLFGGALSLRGWKRIAFNYLAYLARKLYDVSDVIGCMSPANIRFLTENEPKLDQNKIEICPNCVTPFTVDLTGNEKLALRRQYGIPEDKVIFVYGGNLGVPQGIDFAIKSIVAARIVEDAFFVFVGGGTEIEKLSDLTEGEGLNNFLLLPAMPKDAYETLVFACDVGLIYLNYDCPAPNYPSRLLSYMQASLPVLCATDSYSDVGEIAYQNGYGLYCHSDDTNAFVICVEKMCDKKMRKKMGTRSYEYLRENYTSEQVCRNIMERYAKA